MKKQILGNCFSQRSLEDDKPRIIRSKSHPGKVDSNAAAGRRDSSACNTCVVRRGIFTAALWNPCGSLQTCRHRRPKIGGYLRQLGLSGDGKPNEDAPAGCRSIVVVEVRFIVTAATNG